MKQRLMLLLVCLLAFAACKEKPKEMTFVLIPAGSFEMGAGSNYAMPMEGGPQPFIGPYRQVHQPLMPFEDDEIPKRKVTISKAFYISSYEVTQAQWESVMGNNPSFFKGPNLPVETVSWNDIQEFISRLNKKEPGAGYRLPTEAEWEYAARGGTTSLYPTGDQIDTLLPYAWFYVNSKGKTHSVGQKKPNAFGLYDMIGNVWEWTADWYEQTYYGKGENTDPKGPETGVFKVYRGSSWFFYTECCRSADRENSSPNFKTYYLGFRLVKSPE